MGVCVSGKEFSNFLKFFSTVYFCIFITGGFSVLGGEKWAFCIKNTLRRIPDDMNTISCGLI
jgi:hypothetical protein